MSTENKLKLSDEILSESIMAFQLKDGTTFLLSNVDIKTIAKNLWCEIIMNNPQQVIMLNDVSLVRAQELYAIYKAEKNDMSKSLKEKALRNIIELMDTDFDVTTLKEKAAAKK